MKKRPRGKKYKNLTRIGNAIYYQRRIDGERTRVSVGADDWDLAAAAVARFEKDLGIDRAGGGPGMILIHGDDHREVARIERETAAKTPLQLEIEERQAWIDSEKAKRVRLGDLSDADYGFFSMYMDARGQGEQRHDLYFGEAVVLSRPDGGKYEAAYVSTSALHRWYSMRDATTRTAPLKRLADRPREKIAFPLPDKPSIAILPFVNISRDPEQEYFSDGITEEIITALSKVPNLFVIARNSVFTYKGKPVKVKQVSEELGVRYVVEGSVRKIGDRMRITA